MKRLGRPAPQPEPPLPEDAGNELARLRERVATLESQLANGRVEEPVDRRKVVAGAVAAIGAAMALTPKEAKAAGMAVFDATNHAQILVILKTLSESYSTMEKQLGWLTDIHSTVGSGLNTGSGTGAKLFQISAQADGVLGSANMLRGFRPMLDSSRGVGLGALSGGASAGAGGGRPNIQWNDAPRQNGGDGQNIVWNEPDDSVGQNIVWNDPGSAVNQVGTLLGSRAIETGNPDSVRTVVKRRGAAMRASREQAMGMALYHQDSIEKSAAHIQTLSAAAKEAAGEGGDLRAQMAVLTSCVLAAVEEIVQMRHMQATHVQMAAAEGMTQSDTPYLDPDAPPLHRSAPPRDGSLWGGQNGGGQ